MYFDFDGRYSDHEPVGGGLRRWDGLLMSVGVHVLLIVLALTVSALDLFNHRERIAELEQKLAQQRTERPQFVFVQPKVDLKALKPPDRSELSDVDRKSSMPTPAPLPSNPLPYARGNTADRVESSPEERARGEGPEPETAPEPPKDLAQRSVDVPQSQAPLSVPQSQAPKPSGGSLGEALKNLQKYVQKDTFNNQHGNVQDLGPLQFDTKGVEFGPWIRRFVAQVRRNWFIPYAAMTMRGHVVLTFNVHRNGSLTDVQVVQPSPIESFNTAAVNALRSSNPTEPLPPEYPDDQAFFTVTFYYNETPGQ
ncbi:MAG TPA: energy transducer TonB [Vicinamibacterales bacterium]|nr:energy transducer TonB [Vicinamibacterales bacterium]